MIEIYTALSYYNRNEYTTTATTATTYSSESDKKYGATMYTKAFEQRRTDVRKLVKEKREKDVYDKALEEELQFLDITAKEVNFKKREIDLLLEEETEDNERIEAIKQEIGELQRGIDELARATIKK